MRSDAWRKPALCLFRLQEFLDAAAFLVTSAGICVWSEPESRMTVCAAPFFQICDTPPGR